MRLDEALEKIPMVLTKVNKEDFDVIMKVVNSLDRLRRENARLRTQLEFARIREKQND